jgi:hypothetical protein
MPNSKDARSSRRSALMRAAIELSVVGGACLVFLRWIAPNYIAAGTNLGLPPAMLPTSCAVAIGLLAMVQFGCAVFMRDGRSGRDEVAQGNAAIVAGLIAAAIGASVLIDYAGLVVAGGAMTGLASILLGQRRVVVVAVMALAGAGVMLLVAWSGL